MAYAFGKRKTEKETEMLKMKKIKGLQEWTVVDEAGQVRGKITRIEERTAVMSKDRGLNYSVGSTIRKVFVLKPNGQAESRRYSARTNKEALEDFMSMLVMREVRLAYHAYLASREQDMAHFLEKAVKGHRVMVRPGVEVIVESVTNAGTNGMQVMGRTSNGEVKAGFFR